MPGRLVALVNVIVTGVSSFVGCHLARHFAKRGHSVIGTISRERDGYAGIATQRLAAVQSHVTLQRLDLRESGGIAALIEDAAPDLWVHHAGFATDYASANYDASAANAINVRPLDELYATLRGSRCAVIVTGSSMEYGNSKSADQEDAPSNAPATPYGQSKVAQTRRSAELAEKHGVPTRVARLYIPFGAWDNPAKLLPSVVAKLRAGTTINLSPCTQRRDLVGIADVCYGYERLAGDLTRKTFDVFNIASGTGSVLRDVLTALADRLGAARDLLRFGALPMRAEEADVSFASIEKARRWLSWTPRPLEQAIDDDLLHHIA